MNNEPIWYGIDGQEKIGRQFCQELNVYLGRK
jgi:hypothetical protein